MANFTTHIAAGTLISGALATLTLAADVVAPENVIAVAAAGILGSVMPDIDLKQSRASQAFFAGLALFISFALLFSFAEKLSIAELWIVWIGSYIGIRYCAHALFHRISYHRGIFHSLLAAVWFALMTVVIYRYLLFRHEGVAWLAGGFMLIGVLVHLALDELYSVDAMGARVKRSFGTALKFMDRRKPVHSALMGIAVAGTLFMAPPATVFVEGISSKALWVELQDKLLPKSKWFGVWDAKPWDGFASPAQAQAGEGAQPANGIVAPVRRQRPPETLPSADGSP
ncbi:MAG: metal-dependent hydrolase [Pseudomonadota bacterium]